MEGECSSLGAAVGRRWPRRTTLPTKNAGPAFGPPRTRGARCSHRRGWGPAQFRRRKREREASGLVERGRARGVATLGAFDRDDLPTTAQPLQYARPITLHSGTMAMTAIHPMPT